MLRPLVIDFDYSILHSASGQIARVFWETNNGKRFNPTVVCSSQNTGIKSNCELVHVDECTLLRRATSAVKRLGFPDLCHIPDQRRFSWMPFVLHKLKGMDIKEYDYIHSISCPESSHLLALELKRKSSLPWVAQFNDPWIENEAKIFKTSRFKRKDEKLELEVAKTADLIIHTNRVIYENWCERYDESIRSKMVVLPLSFNIMNLPDHVGSSCSDDKFRIFHIGHLYGKRSAKDVFDALAIIKENNPSLADKLEMIFIGTLSMDDMVYAKQCGVEDLVKYIGVIHPDELTEYYQLADMFLVIDMEVLRSPSFPSKLMLYHYYQKPILGITTHGSIIEEDLQASGHKSYLYGDSVGIASYLTSAIKGEVDVSCFDRSYWKKFSVENVTNLYIDNISRLFEDESNIDNRC